MTLEIMDFRKALKTENIPAIMDFVRNSPHKRYFYNYKSEDGNNAFHVVAKCGTVDDLQYLIKAANKHNIDTTEVRNKKGQTALHMACTRETDDNALVKCLLQNKSLMCIKDKEGNLPLHLATQRGLSTVVSALCEEGKKFQFEFERKIFPDFLFITRFDIHAKNNLHQSAFRIAGKINNETIKLILAAYGGHDHFQEALNSLYQNDVASLFSIIETHKDVVHERDESGNTLLHHAMMIQNSNSRIVLAKLIQHGAQINSLNSEKNTPLHCLSQLGLGSHFTQSDATTLLGDLLRFGAKINAANASGYTPLHYAAAHNNKEAIDLFISKGADVKWVSNDGLTPLHVAAWLNKIEAFKHLVERHRADINCAAYPTAGKLFEKYEPNDQPSITPLWIALHNENVPVLEYIVNLKLRRGETKDLKEVLSPEGNTLYHFFVEQNSVEVCTKLNQHQFNPYIQNKKGYSALHIAAMLGNEALVKVIRSSSYRFDKEARTKEGKTPWRLAHEQHHEEVSRYLLSQGATQASIRLPTKSISEHWHDQREFGTELENTWSYTIGNIALKSMPVVIALPFGPVAVGAAIGTQLLTYTAPSTLLHYGSKAHYWAKPLLHNHTHWTVETAFDKVSCLPRWGLLGYQYSHYLRDPVRHIGGTAFSYIAANGTAYVTQNKEVQGLAYLLGREAVYMAVDAARHYNESQSNAEFFQQQAEQQLLQGLNISRSLFGKTWGDGLANAVNGIVNTRNSLYHFVASRSPNLGLVSYCDELMGDAYKSLIQVANKGVELIATSRMMPLHTGAILLSKTYAELVELKKQFYEYVEDTVHDNIIDSEYKDYAIAYLLKARATLQAQDAHFAQVAKDVAQKAFIEAETALASVEQIEGIISQQQINYNDAKATLEEATTLAQAAQTLSDSSTLKFQEAWNITPRGMLENNLHNAQTAQSLAYTNEEVAKLELQHVKNTTPNSERIVELEEKLKAAQDQHNVCKSHLAEKEIALQETLSDFEKEYYAKLEQERVKAFDNNLKEYKENTAKLLDTSFAYEQSSETVFNDEITVYNAEQQVKTIELQLDPVNKILESLAHPGPFIASNVVTAALRTSNNALDVADFIIKAIVATGVISEAEARLRMRGNFSTAHNSSDRFESLKDIVTQHWNLLQDGYKTNYLIYKNSLTTKLTAAQLNLQQQQQRLVHSRQQLSADQQSLKALLSDNQLADFSQSVALTQQQWNEQFWQATHTPAQVKEVVSLIGQLNRAHYLAHDLNLAYTPNFQDKYTNETLAKWFVEYKYFFLASPPKEQRDSEIAQVAAQLEKSGLSPQKITQARNTINAEIAKGLLKNESNTTALEISENIYINLQRGLGFAEEAVGFKEKLSGALEAGEYNLAKEAIENTLEIFSHQLSVKEIGQWQEQPLPERDYPVYTGANEKHGITAFLHQPLKKTKEIAKDIFSHATPGSTPTPYIGLNSDGQVYAGALNGNMFELHNFNRPTQVLFKLPQQAVSLTSGASATSITKPLPSAPLPSVLSSKPGEAARVIPSLLSPGQFSLVSKQSPTAIGRAHNPSEPVLPLSTYLPSLAPKAPTFTPAMLAQTANQTAIAPPRRIKNTAVKVVRAPNTLEKTTSINKRQEFYLEVVSNTGKHIQNIPDTRSQNQAVSVVPVPEFPKNKAISWWQLAYRSAKGETSPEVRAWQQTNIESAPGWAISLTEGISKSTVPLSRLPSIFNDALTESVKELINGVTTLGQYAASEVKLHLQGEELQTQKAIALVGVFIGEETARLALREKTETTQFVKQLVSEFDNLDKGERVKALAKLALSFSTPAVAGVKLTMGTESVVQKVVSAERYSLRSSTLKSTLTKAIDDLEKASSSKASLMKSHNETQFSSFLKQFEEYKIGKSTSFQSLSINRSTPAEIFYGYGELTRRQTDLLSRLPNDNSRFLTHKSNFNVRDLSALTAKTGDEFAMFTLGSQRLIIRGTSRGIEIDADLLNKLKIEKWKWSAHTHPGTSDLVLNASGIPGDRDFLQALGQERSLILNSSGHRNVFDKNDNTLISKSNKNDLLKSPSSKKLK